MSDLHDFEKEVMEWYESNWNGRVLPLFKKTALTMETSLSTGKYPWANEDAIEIVDDYFRRFNVDRKNFSFV